MGTFADSNPTAPSSEFASSSTDGSVSDPEYGSSCSCDPDILLCPAIGVSLSPVKSANREATASFPFLGPFLDIDMFKRT